MENHNAKQVCLIILDGWGVSPQVEGNAVAKAATPVIDSCAKAGTYFNLHAAGEAVGLPWGEAGNSEVGHVNIGSGRVVLSDYTQITSSINDKSFEKNAVFKAAIDHVKTNHSRLHLIGLLSDATVHGNIEHLVSTALLSSQNGIKPFIHLISDGRDTAPKIAIDLIQKFQAAIDTIGPDCIATISGRYYAMDRDKHYDRTEIAYNIMVEGKGETASSAKEAIKNGYDNRLSDEFIVPTLINRNGMIGKNDAAVMTNFRADRAIQLAKSLIDKRFDGFKRQLLQNLYLATMTEYEHGIGAKPLFSVVDLNNPKSNPLANPVAQVLSQNRLSQLHAAESEKSAHVTYFFNAGAREPYTDEYDLIVPSSKIASYGTVPQMSARELTNQFIKKWLEISPSFSLINYANADMVGHTGDLNAAVSACQTVDSEIGQILYQLIPRETIVVISADHGNAEEMVHPENKIIDKEHSINPVPFIIIDKNSLSGIKEYTALTLDDKLAYARIEPVGLLADIAPTVLSLMEVNQPAEMTGQSLI